MPKCEPNEKGNEKGRARIKKVSHKPQYVYSSTDDQQHQKCRERDERINIIDAIHNIEASKNAKAPPAAAATLSFAPVHMARHVCRMFSSTDFERGQSLDKVFPASS
jgi:hypothetical protein